MINFTYTEEENKYRVQLDNLVVFGDEDLPLHVEFRRVVDGEVGWDHELKRNHFVEWKGGDIDYHVFVYTKRGTLVFERPFNVELDGSRIEKTFHFFIQQLGHRPRGIVIGPHNGQFGHWVYDVLADKTDVVFVEGTNSHLDELKKTYGHLSKVKFLNEIVTANGAPVAVTISFKNLTFDRCP